MSHLTLEKRKIICNMLSRGCKCCEIASVINCDPTTIAKEIKRNRIGGRDASKGQRNILCNKLDKWPYVCINCKFKYSTCTFLQLKYDPVIAQKKYEIKLKNSRAGINLNEDEYLNIVYLLKKGLKAKQSIYAILKLNKINIGVSTIYRYIAEKKIPITKLDLPYAVTYKKRKKKIKEYDYKDNKIDRSNRTYLDYLSYIHARINEMTVQMDFLGSIKTDIKSILVLIIPELHFVFLFSIEKKNSNKVVDVFNFLEDLIGYEKFSDIFPSILTDRDPSFSNIDGIEFSHETGQKRTNLFFCDAFKSNQKASVENMNKQIRKFFPKGKSVDYLSQENIRLIAKTINETPLYSLDGATPKEVFCQIFGLATYDKIFGE